jgi:hypothetical protein
MGRITIDIDGVTPDVFLYIMEISEVSSYVFLPTDVSERLK